MSDLAQCQGLYNTVCWGWPLLLSVPMSSLLPVEGGRRGEVGGRDDGGQVRGGRWERFGGRGEREGWWER